MKGQPTAQGRLAAMDRPRNSTCPSTHERLKRADVKDFNEPVPPDLEDTDEVTSLNTQMFSLLVHAHHDDCVPGLDEK